ncbi:MAG TPA: O-antigen ligase family protein, partial [Planctomycetota bacterium]|nr:O-antigen ligase family protein [Planctomycetota bacterium]
FVAAGSAGAVAALLGALPIAAALGAPPRSPRRRRAALLVAAWLAGCLTLAAAANASTAPTGKTATLRERLDYARTGLRMAADSGPFGVGLERVAESAPRYRRPGEAFSRSLHNWWLEGWVEAGIWFVLAAAPATWSILRRLRSVAATTSSTPPVAAPRDRAWPIGIALGVAVAGLAARSVRFTPYGAIADPTVDVVVNAALATAVVLAFRRLAADVGVDGPLPRRAAAIGLLAFLLHGWIDYDLKVAGVAVAFGAWWGASTAAAPAGAVARRADRIAAAALGAAALLAPLIVGPAE